LTLHNVTNIPLSTHQQTLIPAFQESILGVPPVNPDIFAKRPPALLT
jgi:hypothetical protein